MKTTIEAQKEITSSIQVLEFKTATDGALLLMEAIGINGLPVAKIYKSFNERFQPIVIVRYVNSEY